MRLIITRSMMLIKSDINNIINDLDDDRQLIKHQVPITLDEIHFLNSKYLQYTMNESSKKCAAGKVTNLNGTIELENPHLKLLNPDILYHLGFDSSQDLEEMFGDVKFVCMGGTPKRMEEFANYIMEAINYTIPVGTQLMDICFQSHRYSMFKVGPVIAVSHGMGVPSISILLHELIKLMSLAKCNDPIFIRLGTCGGVGIPGGTVVLSENAVDGMCNDFYELSVLGKSVRRPCVFDKQIIKELEEIALNNSIDVVKGTTLCALDFYEGQARLDGAFCDYSEEEKNSYIQDLQGRGIINIEMESLPFGALTYQAGIRSAVICVSLLDRTTGDQVAVPKATFSEWERKPQEIVKQFIVMSLNSA